MKNVYIAAILLAIVFTIAQVRAGESSSLNDYYSDYAVPILSAQQQAKQGKDYPGCRPYGDDTVNCDLDDNESIYVRPKMVFWIEKLLNIAQEITFYEIINRITNCRP